MSLQTHPNKKGDVHKYISNLKNGLGMETEKLFGKSQSEMVYDVRRVEDIAREGKLRLIR